jgi:short-subunit dehydrogenase
MAMANPGTGCIWVTGASSGIGSEVAVKLAEGGHKVAISARSGESLRNLVREQENTNLHDFELDVTDGNTVTQTAAAIEAELGHVHTAVLCAGTYKPISAGTFDAMEAHRQVDANVGGVLNCLDPLLRAMLARRTGHIAIVSSLTSRFGLPNAGVYGASKAGLVNLAEALRVECEGNGVTIQVINPGFVETPLTQQNTFDMPFLVSVDQAAKTIVTGLATDRFEIAFPWQMDLATRFLRFLPRRLAFALTRRMVTS